MITRISVLRSLACSRAITAGERVCRWFPTRIIFIVYVFQSIIHIFCQLSRTPEGAQIPLLDEALALLDSITSNPVPEPALNSPARSAFDPSISRKLVAVTPLKAIPLMDQGAAWKALETMLTQLRDLYVATYQGGYRTLTWMVNLFRQRLSSSAVTDRVSH